MKKIITLFLAVSLVLLSGCQTVKSSSKNNSNDTLKLEHIVIKVISDRSDYFRYKIDITPEGLVTVTCGDPVKDFNVDKPLKTVQSPISTSYFAGLLNKVDSFPDDGIGSVYGENLWRFEIMIGSKNYTYVYGIEHNKDMKNFENFIDKLMREIPIVKESWIYSLWIDGNLK
jgi:hypothetical protein